MRRALAQARVRRSSLGIGLALVLLGTLALGGVSGRGAAAQDDPGTPTAGASTTTTVTVGGRGVVTIEPDTASVVVGVEVFEPTLSEAQAEATRQMTAVTDAILAAGLEERDIQTVNYSVNIVYEYDANGTPERIEGFQVSNQVSIRIRDLDTLGSLLDAVVAEGANTIYGISFFVDDPTAAASQARIAAVRDARRKADELAEAAGMSVARIITITESNAPPPTPEVFAGAAADVAESAARVPIQTGTSEVAVDVQVTYELR